MRELLLRTATGILLVVLFIGSILLGPTPMLMMMLVVFGLGTRELFRLKSISMSLPSLLLVASGALIITGVFALLKLGMNPLWFILPAILWIAGYAWKGTRNPGLLVLFWISIPLASFIATGWFFEGSWNSLLPIAIIALVWVNDTFAYVTGSLVGKHPLTPRLSPGKTWEGFAGGLLFTMLAAWIFYHFTGLQTPATWIAAGAITSLFAMAGDLFESGLKRKYKVKDTGEILPGHGGILDRFDSLLFVAPAMFLLLLLYTDFQMIRIHKEGRLIVSITLLLGLALVTVSALWLPPWTRTLAVIFSLAIQILVLRFFRNPIRKFFKDEKTIVAPADGKVVVIEKVNQDEFLGKEAIQVSIFMSIHDVHINYFPVDGEISYLKYHPGKYLLARFPKSSELNERYSVGIDTPHGTLLVRQVAGYVARRIRNYAVLNRRAHQGREMGFIKFGSRLDLFLPTDAILQVELNQRVSGGVSPVARFK